MTFARDPLSSLVDVKSEGKSVLKGFRDFVLRGNVVDLAVGVVIGAAFGTVVAALVKDLLTPVIAAVGQKPDFSAFFFEVNGAKFLYGDFLQHRNLFSADCRSGVLLRRTAGQQSPQPSAEASAPGQEKVPGVQQ